MWFQIFRRSASARVTDTGFHAVDIVTSGTACKAVKHLAGTRFLSRGRPPQLPLGNCDFPATCACRYRHHEDRRKDSRRHTDHAWGNAAPLPADRERRRVVGRRASDPG